MNPMQFAGLPPAGVFFWGGKLTKSPVLIHFEDVLMCFDSSFFCFGHSQSGKGDCIHKDYFR